MENDCKTSTDSEINPYDTFRKKFNYLDDADFNILVTLIKQLQFEDPVLVIEWNTEALEVAKKIDPNNNKCSIINTISTYNGLDPIGNGMIFCFRSMSDFTNCRNHLPVWSRSLSPLASSLAGIESRPLVGIGQLIIGTDRCN
jgi:hypothetical protein